VFVEMTGAEPQLVPTEISWGRHLMKINSITLRGYRCFDEVGQTFDLDDLTCFVGPNASGKTAAMMALVRMFGEAGGQRRILPSDFHLAYGEELSSKPIRTLTIECRLRFPELDSDGAGTVPGVPETFNQMIVDDPEGTPYCRIRLEATWTDDHTVSGEVDQSLWWITTNSEDETIIQTNNRIKVQPGDRSRIRVIYVGAVRDPEEQIRTTTSTSFGRTLESLEWNGADTLLDEKLGDLRTLIDGIPGVEKLNRELQQAWTGLYNGEVAKRVAFKSGDEDAASLIKGLVPSFGPGEDRPNITVRELSDGLRSLFSLSLSLGLFHVEELIRQDPVAAGFRASLVETAPIVTLFTIEEPENHLSPQYLGRIVAQVKKLSANPRAQVVLSSHSPSILSRIEPDNVRYFLGHEFLRVSEVKSIPLPEDHGDESFKYVREAVRGFPELYFARLVILGEGPSEEIVFRRQFEASGAPLDQHFISVAPLGGRHVNHFWRLLHGLSIPYLTVLDLDREKEGAGWGRIQYVRNQLVTRFGAGNAGLQFEDEQGVVRSLDDPEFDALHENADTDVESMAHWLTVLAQKFDIYFMFPLDLDFAMLECFPGVYQNLAPSGHGPRLPDPTDVDYLPAIDRRMKQVLAPDASKAPTALGSSYTPAQQKLFPWYKYLFVDGSKPVTHMLALLKIEDDDLSNGAPETLKQLVIRARSLVQREGDP
jgi:putative ATP-dependent endonuclease of the OLD family